MADSLSQKDIDSLLKGHTSVAVRAPATAAEVEAVPYNFLRPPRIASDRQATLDGIFSRFALSVQALLSSRLRTPTDVTVSSVEQATFAEFIFSLANPCAAFVVDLGDQIGGQGVLDLSTEMAYYLVDKLFGGPGEITDAKRPLTSLEQSVVKGIAVRTLAAISEAWNDYVPFDLTAAGFESTPDALQIAGRDENVLVTNVEVRSGHFSGLLTWCVPLHTLESFLQEKPSRVSNLGHESEADQAKNRGTIAETLKSTLVDMSARFPTFRLSAGEVANLKAGSLIHTGYHTGVPLELLILNRKRFQGTIGKVKGFTGFRVFDTVTDIDSPNYGKAPKGRLL